MDMVTAPCKNCEKKGCGSFHSECKQYQEWKEFRQKANDEHRKYLENRAMSFGNSRRWQ